MASGACGDRRWRAALATGGGERRWLATGGGAGERRWRAEVAIGGGDRRWRSTVVERPWDEVGCERLRLGRKERQTGFYS